jgi:hypothetical protein
MDFIVYHLYKNKAKMMPSTLKGNKLKDCMREIFPDDHGRIASLGVCPVRY